jgi:DNA excision repair protein ERCC-1
VVHAQQSRSATGARQAVAAATTAATTGGISSFSQAFESIEDTSHYRGQIQKHKNAANPAEVETRAQQRAFDAAAQQNLADTSHTSMTDRDQHALLQPHVLYVSTKQRGNAVLNFIRNVPFAYSTMVPDYIMSTTRCALFLSLKYHSLYPDYIHRRIAEIRSDLTLILAWSEEEAARYLETFKAFDGKDASIIQKKEQTHFADQVADFLGTSKINKTDSGQLLSQFSNLRSLMEASMDELGLVAGMGEVKVRRLHDAFHKPFSSKAAAKRQKTRQEEEELEDDEGSKEQEFGDDDADVEPDGEEEG